MIQDESLPDNTFYHETALQEYILICCQHPDGGLIDKPGKPRDVYHTCYTLSGLSVAQSNGKLIGGMHNKLVSSVLRNYLI